MRCRVLVLSLTVTLVVIASFGAISNSMALSDDVGPLTCIREDPIASVNGTPTPTDVFETGMGIPFPIDVQPTHELDAQVIPKFDGPGAPKDGTFFGRELYLVVITVPPGECVPLEVTGNHREGAVIWIVQQGSVHFAWQPIASPVSDATPEIELGNNDGPIGMIDPRDPTVLKPGDWISQDRQVEVTYTNVGDEDAIILKAVFAVREGGGCRGGCK